MSSKLYKIHVQCSISFFSSSFHFLLDCFVAHRSSIEFCSILLLLWLQLLLLRSCLRVRTPFYAIPSTGQWAMIRCLMSTVFNNWILIYWLTQPKPNSKQQRHTVANCNWIENRWSVLHSAILSIRKSLLVYLAPFANVICYLWTVHVFHFKKIQSFSMAVKK